MILRRFMKHVREQNWFAVGLDVLVVIVGIFLGIQVSELHQDRKNDELETLYIERIYEDLQASLVTVEERKVGHQQRGQQVKSVLDWLSGYSDIFPADQAWQNGLCRWYAPASTEYQNFAFEELVASGQMQLIKDPQLRLLLQQVQGKRAAADFDFNVLSIPVQTKARILEPYIFFKPTHEENIVVHTDFNSGTICEFDIEGLKNSRQALSVIAQLYRSQLIYSDFLNEQTTFISKTLDYIKSMGYVE